MAGDIWQLQAHLKQCDGTLCELWELMLQVVSVTEKSIVIPLVEPVPVLVCVLLVVCCDKQEISIYIVIT